MIQQRARLARMSICRHHLVVLEGDVHLSKRYQVGTLLDSYHAAMVKQEAPRISLPMLAWRLQQTVSS